MIEFIAVAKWVLVWWILIGYSAGIIIFNTKLQDKINNKVIIFICGPVIWCAAIGGYYSGFMLCRKIKKNK